MPSISPKSLLGFLFSALFVLAIVFLDPQGKVFEDFNKNYDKSNYFEQCDKNSLLQSASSTFFHVVEVTDGDTITISKECKPITVRLIGIDTPETVDPRKPVQCFGIESSNFTKRSLLKRNVKIETDLSQDLYDKYGRLLAYVILEEGTNFNKILLEEGFAHEYTYKVPYKYQLEFKEAEKLANMSKRGLWNPEACKE